MSLESLRVATSALRSPILDYQRFRFGFNTSTSSGDDLQKKTVSIWEAVGSQKANLGNYSSVKAIFENWADYIQLDHNELLILTQIAQLRSDELLSDLMQETRPNEITKLSQNALISNAMALVALDLLVDENKKEINKPELVKTFATARGYYRTLFDEAKTPSGTSGLPNAKKISTALDLFKIEYMANMEALSLKFDVTGGTGSTIINDFDKLFGADYSKYTPEELCSQASIYLSNSLRIASSIITNPKIVKIAAPIIASHNCAAQHLTHLALLRMAT